MYQKSNPSVSTTNRSPPTDPFATNTTTESGSGVPTDDEISQLLYCDFLSYNPDGPSENEIATDELRHRDSDEVQRAKNFWDDFAICESNTQESSFWKSSPANTSPSTPTRTLEQSHFQNSQTEPLPPSRGPEQALPAPQLLSPIPPASPPSRTVTAPNKRPDVYATTIWLAEHANIVFSNGCLYFYHDGVYLPKRPDDARRELMDLCRPIVESCGNPRFVSEVYNALLVEPRICRDGEFNPNVVALEDGLLDVQSGTLLPHTPGIFATTKLRGSYISGKHQDCPVFKSFLHVISAGDTDLEQRIWEILGYLFVPEQAAKAFVLFQGVPNSGKSALGNFVCRCFDGDVVSALEINDLQRNFALSDLVGKHLCVDFDLPADPFKNKAVSALKKLTGSDAVSSDVKFKDRIRFQNMAKFLFATNHMVLLRKDDEAFFDRLVVVPFSVAVEKRHRDVHLAEKLDAERSAIIVRALDAYRGLVRNNFAFAGDFQINDAVTPDDSSIAGKISIFLHDFCLLEKDAWVSTDALFTTFSLKFGRICSKNTFARNLLLLCRQNRLNVEKQRKRIASSNNPLYGFQGLKIRN